MNGFNSRSHSSLKKFFEKDYKDLHMKRIITVRNIWTASIMTQNIRACVFQIDGCSSLFKSFKTLHSYGYRVHFHHCFLFLVGKTLLLRWVIVFFLQSKYNQVNAKQEINFLTLLLRQPTQHYFFILLKLLNFSCYLRKYCERR